MDILENLKTKNVYTNGPIIHNPQVVKYLESKGVKSVDDVSKLRKGVLVIRTHGIKKDSAIPKTAGLRVIDATCPFVKRAQEIVTREGAAFAIAARDMDEGKLAETAAALGKAISDAMIEEGFKRFAKLWRPILKVFEECGVKFALEVHPTEIAFDLFTAKRALKAIRHHKCFGFNFDPSHLLWQGVDPVKFIEEFPDRIFHVHMKDATVALDGRRGILASHLNFGDPNRGWDFRSPGRGKVNFEEIIRALNRIGYDGPLSVEWEDSGMDREHGAREACEFVRKVDFAPSQVAFDAAFDQ